MIDGHHSSGKNPPVNITMLSLALMITANASAQIDLPSSVQLDPRVSLKPITKLGNLALYENLGWLSCNGEELFPLVVCYFSDPTKWNSSVLPPGWTLPLFDSHVVQLSEDSIEVLLPTGRTIWLSKDSASGTWSGMGFSGIEKNDNFVLSQGQLSFVFDQGRIQQIRSGDTTLNWERDTAAGSRILNNGRTLVTLSKNTEDTITSLLLETSKGKRGIKFEHDPAAPRGIQLPIDSGLALPSLQTIKSDLVNRTHNFSFTALPDKGYSIEQRVFESGLEISRQSVVTNRDGIVAWLNNNPVSVIYPDKRFSTPMIVLRKETGDQLFQAGHGANGGLQLKATLEGVIERVYSVLPTAPHSSVLRKETITKPDGTIVETYRASYDSEGRLLQDKAGTYQRRVINGTITVTKDDSPWNNY